MALAMAARRWPRTMPFSQQIRHFPSGCAHANVSYKLMPMPRLSPSMSRGVLERWHLSAGDQISTYDLVCDVSTDELLDEPSSPTFVLEVESHEDGWLAKVLVAEGGAAAPDMPIAVICENEEDVHLFKDFSVLKGEQVPTGSFCWQAFLKKDTGD
uniref:Lipoyl-binding domain-containing protein n=1 Tax=Calcidiscus leptoporus TaxID=127549 RepID=A0A7S0IYL7_9EUKA|mmetsp:Transcript_2874/g.6518  ORF Transcript_2874/g.6518 Transcript_2874/m.6518 type:complete len:156 (+) Transcript_2874:75-542(+)